MSWSVVTQSVEASVTYGRCLNNTQVWGNCISRHIGGSSDSMSATLNDSK
ncbi:MAG: hypothetical protein LBJ92_00580 [Holosporales bacterium]|nr:hypothetical protein [Holosporales bacterium]